jgi:hypothetical protein
MATQAIRHTETPADWADALAAHGYCIIPNLVDTEVIRALDDDLQPHFARTLFCHGDFYGQHTKRMGSVLTRSPHSATLVQHPLVLDIVGRLLAPWCDTLQLNLTQAIEIHPGAPRQFPHRDQDMWAGTKGEVEYLVNIMWPFTPYREENGATLVFPESHAARALAPEPTTDCFAAELDPGSALLFLGSTLHGAGANRSTEIRRGMIVSYCLGWLKPYENQWLAYPPEVARRFPADLAGLVGYRQHRPNLGNYEGQCPSILLRDRLPDRLGAVDALRPDQAELAAAYRERVSEADQGCVQT